MDIFSLAVTWLLLIVWAVMAVAILFGCYWYRRFSSEHLLVYPYGFVNVAEYSPAGRMWHKWRETAFFSPVALISGVTAFVTGLFHKTILEYHESKQGLFYYVVEFNLLLFVILVVSVVVLRMVVLDQEEVWAEE